MKTKLMCPACRGTFFRVSERMDAIHPTLRTQCYGCGAWRDITVTKVPELDKDVGMEEIRIDVGAEVYQSTVASRIEAICRQVTERADLPVEIKADVLQLVNDLCERCRHIDEMDFLAEQADADQPPGGLPA